MISQQDKDPETMTYFAFNAKEHLIFGARAQSHKL
jgi:hypothetical protein